MQKKLKCEYFILDKILELIQDLISVLYICKHDGHPMKTEHTRLETFPHKVNVRRSGWSVSISD